MASTLPLPPSAEPLEKRDVPLQRQAYAQVKQLIVTGEAPPGSFLSQRQLALRFGMSKTPIHVALDRLEAEGFVDIAPQQGVVVRGMTIQDIVEHYELRQAIEGFVAGKLAGNLTPDQRERIGDVLARQRRCCGAADATRYVELDTEFHLLLCDCLANRQLTQVMGQQRDRIHQVIIRIISQDPGRMAGSVDEHAAMAEAIFQGDAQRAARLAVDHLEYGKQRILNPKRF